MTDDKKLKGEDRGLGVCKCGVAYAEEAHPCPFAEEINDDSETLCSCCDDCANDCAMDI